jgi:hypothetical protein
VQEKTKHFQRSSRAQANYIARRHEELELALRTGPVAEGRVDDLNKAYSGPEASAR